MADGHEYFGEDVLTTRHGIFASAVGMGKQHPPKTEKPRMGPSKSDRLLQEAWPPSTSIAEFVYFFSKAFVTKSWKQRCFIVFSISCRIILFMEELLNQLIGGLSHYLQGFIHPSWLFGISEPSTVSCCIISCHTIHETPLYLGG